MSPEDYIHQQIVDGKLTMAHIALLVRDFQTIETGLVVDGKPGPKTIARIDEILSKQQAAGVATKHEPSTPVLSVPMPVLADGRHAVMTSGFHTVNPDRPTHNGADFFYHWKEGDKPDKVGDGGAAGRDANGKPKWVVPFGVEAIAAADGKVQIAGNSATGYRLWIDHGNGWRTGYFHLQNLNVSVGQEVFKGQPLGRIGDNPKDTDGRHLHFELSPVDRYAPVDPMPYVK